jgi:ferredoxin
MVRNIIIGSGPAAAGAALALVELGEEVVVLDVGSVLEEARRDALIQVSGKPPSLWDKQALDVITELPVAQSEGQLPQKRSYGSDYPFRDLGQLEGVSVVGSANDRVVSSAYGGFSNVWGAQIMPYSSSALNRDWPLTSEDLQPHYGAILEEVPLAGAVDDLAEDFPLLGKRHDLPEASPRTQSVLANYARHRNRVREHGVTMGSARLALHASRCKRVGLCMTGCPYGLVYSASQTFNRLRSKRQITYHSGMLALRLSETEQGAEVLARDLADASMHTFRGDRLFVACGAIGSTRLVLGSLAKHVEEVTMAESAQIVLPFFSRRRTTDPRGEPAYTLNQFNMAVDLPGSGGDVAHVHCYPYNPAYEAALPGFLQKGIGIRLGTEAIRHVTAGLAYLPSWASPRVKISVVSGAREMLPRLSISSDGQIDKRAYRRLLGRLTRIAPLIDLWPVPFAGSVSGAAKSYHVGGSFPHTSPGKRKSPLETDLLGRLPEWRRIHLIDGSVFPSVPATTFTLTVMANAHRIATASATIGNGS